MLTIYGYAGCSTCTKAKRALFGLGADFQWVDITESPPPRKLLRALLSSGEYKLADLFNRSGQRYRELDMKTRLKTMSESDAIALLASEGKLCKRPIVTDGERHTVGYKPERFAQIWS